MSPTFISEEEFQAMLAKRMMGGANARVADNASKCRSVSNPTPSPYKSKWESAYAAKLDLEVRAGVIRSWRYEPMSFKLSKGKRYRPDFMVVHPDGLEKRIEFREVKSRVWGKNRRDGITHLSWCAQLYPMFTWTLIFRNGQGWEEQPVQV